MEELTLHVPTKVHFGAGFLGRVGPAAAGYGSRALIVADSVFSDEPGARSIRDYLRKSGVESILFDETGPGSTSTAIEKGLAICRGSRAELIIGVGGVRALSHAKLLARLARGTASVDDYLFAPPAGGAMGGALPLILVPTTCRDPFLLSDGCLVVDARNRRASILRLDKSADAAIVDPLLTLSLSRQVTVATLLDTFLAAVESYFSRSSTFLSETLSLRAIGVITSILDELAQHPEEPGLRTRASEAGFLVSLSLTMSTLGMGSAVAYAVAGKTMVPKAMVSTVMIPYVLEMGMLSQPKKVERVGNVLGEEIYGKPLSEFSVQVVEAVRQRMGLLDVPMRLKDLELDLADMAEISQAAYELPIAHFLAEPTSPDGIHRLIKQAF